jgi:hypothetical protein
MHCDALVETQGQLRFCSRRLADPADRRSVAGPQILIGLAARRSHNLKLTLSIRHCASGWQKLRPFGRMNVLQTQSGTIKE